MNELKNAAQRILDGFLAQMPKVAPKVKSDRWGSRNKYDRKKCREEGKR